MSRLKKLPELLDTDRSGCFEGIDSNSGEIMMVVYWFKKDGYYQLYDALCNSIQFHEMNVLRPIWRVRFYYPQYDGNKEI